jgi:phosphoglycolate phosphatase
MSIPRSRPCRLFLFDLDGTLIDSHDDIVDSINLALVRMHLPSLNAARIGSFVGDGIQTLIERTLREATGKEPNEALTEKGLLLFREEYSNHLLDQTCLCHQAKEALDLLSWAKFAVITNKPEDFSRRILEGLGIAKRFSMILGGDSVQNRKPNPEALLKAMDFCQASPDETAMIGDSAVDIEAGKAAGVTTCGIPGKFRAKAELEAAGCDLFIQNLTQLADHFHPPA